MTISPLELYLLLKLDSLIKVLPYVGIPFYILSFIFLLSFLREVYKKGGAENRRIRSDLMKSVGLFALAGFFWFAANLLPSTKEALVIVVVPKVVNSDFVQQDIPEETKAVYRYLKDYLLEKVDMPDPAKALIPVQPSSKPVSKPAASKAAVDEKVTAQPAGPATSLISPDMLTKAVELTKEVKGSVEAVDSGLDKVKVLLHPAKEKAK